MRNWRVTYYSYGVKECIVRAELFELAILIQGLGIEHRSVISIEQVAEQS